MVLMNGSKNHRPYENDTLREISSSGKARSWAIQSDTKKDEHHRVSAHASFYQLDGREI